jgi:hypothetical protein
MELSTSPSRVILVAQAAPTNLTHTGDTVESTLLTVVLPAMGANDAVRVESLWTHTGSAGTWTPKVKLGSTLISGGTAQVAGAAGAEYDHTVRNRGATNSQVGRAAVNAGPNAGSSAGNITATEETSTGATLTFTGTLAAGADTIKLDGYRVTVLRA